ncbi:response regulator [Aquabacterium soli]|uniref:Response regulator n=1 Tax=Aquabacterium soli TaxID=2493092 RepID=A0A3R8S2U5_9BURK|nr:response regulator [Aquabacterium soli]
MARILIVEDTPANMLLAGAILQSAGHTLLQASDAPQGLALAREHRPDLVLMDIQLPGMDGLAATRALKSDERTGGIPVLALTAFAMKGDEERMRAAGCAAYVSKPLRYQQLLAAVDDLLVHDAANNEQGVGS